MSRTINLLIDHQFLCLSSTWYVLFSQYPRLLSFTSLSLPVSLMFYFANYNLLPLQVCEHVYTFKLQYQSNSMIIMISKSNLLQPLAFICSLRFESIISLKSFFYINIVDISICTHLSTLVCIFVLPPFPFPFPPRHYSTLKLILLPLCSSILFTNT